MHVFNTYILRFLFAFSFAFISLNLLAEPVLEEVVVTARKVVENEQDVPIAMSVFTASDINDAGIERPEDFIALTPNVVMANTVNVGDTLVTIRGLTSTRDAESNFALVIDGILQTNPNAFNRELLDIAQIEVLKGPQGALYGRNATSGAILITTKAPSEESVRTAVVGMGINNSQKFQYVHSGKGGDNVYTRFSISTRETDGEHTNVYSNQKTVDFFEDRFSYNSFERFNNLVTGFPIFSEKVLPELRDMKKCFVLVSQLSERKNGKVQRVISEVFSV